MQASNFYDPNVGDFVAVDGQIVERQALYLVEKLKEINPDIEVLCLDPDRSDSLGDEPFMICERKGDKLFKIFGCWELNDSVIERVHLADMSRFDIAAEVDKMNALVKKEEARIVQEKRDETKDLVTSIAKNRKSSFTFENDKGEKVTLFEDRPAEKK